MNKINNILKSKFMLVLIFFVLIRPGSFVENPDWVHIGNFLNITKVMICGISTILFLITKNKPSKFLMLTSAYYIILLFTTFIRGGAYYNLLFEFATIVAWIIVIDYNAKFNSKNLISSLAFIFSALIIINFITIIMHPGGMYINSAGYISNYFLGFDNNLITYILPTLVVVFINSYKKYNKLSLFAILIFLICILSVVITWSVTSLVAIMLTLVLFFIYRNYKKLPINKIVLVISIIFITIVVLRLQSVFEPLIVDIFGKDLTFSGRTYIWDSYISAITSSPILGYGIMLPEELVSFVGATHAHNLYLNIAFQGGLVNLVVWAIIYKISLDSLKKSRTKINNYITLILLVYLSISIFEAYATTNMIFLMLLMAMNINNILNEPVKNNKIKETC